MRIKLAAIALVCAASFGEYREALPGYRYEFPRDHFNHPEFRTEWWYYTGNLQSQEGRRFGFELTFFRHNVSRDEPKNVWDIGDVWLAHFALSDISGQRFLHTQRLNRSGRGLAGADLNTRRVWNGNWFVQWRDDGRQRLEAVAEQFRIALDLRPLKQPVIHGLNGVSQKAEGPGRASHYVSFTRIQTSGVITIEGREFTVEGLSWMDHEFFTHQLEPEQTGWDWLSLQFTDGTELMLFRLRRQDGSVDRFSAGTFVDSDGRTRHLTARDFTMTPGARKWKNYPIEWTVHVPALEIAASLTTRLPQQELTTRMRGMTAYWEGAMEVSGTRAGRPLTGHGYLEMTGYAGAVRL
jgi:predicted secreted hydrolase